MTRKMEKEKAGERWSVERLIVNNRNHFGLGSHAIFPRSRDVTYQSDHTVPPSPAVVRRGRSMGEVSIQYGMAVTVQRVLSYIPSRSVVESHSK